MAPELIVTVLAPSFPAATKSLPAASDTVRFTVRLALGAGFAVTVNCAAVPSVTGDVPGAMVIVGVVPPPLAAPLTRILMLMELLPHAPLSDAARLWLSSAILHPAAAPSSSASDQVYSSSPPAPSTTT